MRNKCQQLYHALKNCFSGLTNTDSFPTFRGLDQLEPRLLMSGDSIIVFNEVMYNPAGTDESLEYIELYNQQSVDVDISGWKVDGGVEYEFPEGTVVQGGAYILIAKDPTALAASTGIDQADIFGPFTGQLSNGGENLNLYNHFNTASTLIPPDVIDVNPAELWSVDMQGVGGIIANPTPTTMDGIEFESGLGDVWNAFDIPGHTGTVTNPTLPLVDSAGDPSAVTFSITGTISSWSNNGGPLFDDYLFVNAGNSDVNISWEITGLIPGQTYNMINYGGIARDINLTIDINGDGDLNDEASQLAPAASGLLFESITADPTGKIIGNASPGTFASGEGNWSGFQLYIPPVEPQEIAQLAGLPGDGSNKGRRLMDELDYNDGGLWPVGADGSGASLSKLHPQAGSESPANWHISKQVGGTPGAVNFVTGDVVVQPIDELTDSSGNGNHAVPVNIVLTENNGGFQGEAGIFNGTSSYASVPIDINPAANPQMTFGAWVKSDVSSPMHTIISNDDGAWDRAITIGNGVPTNFNTPNSNIWNNFTVASHSGTSTNPSLALVDSAGQATGVTFSIGGTISSFNSSNGSNLVKDYLFVNAGNADANVTFQISGLIPGAAYDFYNYGGPTRDAGLTVDQDGDGSLLDNNEVFVPGTGYVFENTIADAAGTINGIFDPGSSAEANWSGFELVELGGAGTLISVDLQGDGAGGAFGQSPPITQSGPLPSPPAVGAGYSGFAGGHQFDGTNIAVDTESWAFIAGVFDQTTTTMTIFLDPDASTTADNVLSFTDTATGFGSSALPTNIGRLPSNQWYWDGLMDNVFFYDVALDAAQIKQIRDGGVDAVKLVADGHLLGLTEFEETVDPGGGDTPVILPDLVFNELGASTDALFQLELYNHGSTPIDLENMILRSSDNLAPDFILGAGTLLPGDFLTLDANQLGFSPADEDRLFLFTADGQGVIDAAKVDDSPRGLSPDGGDAWLVPTSPTFGSANDFSISDAIVINEIMYNAYPDRGIPGDPGTPPTYATTTLLPFNGAWRYNQNLSNTGLSTGWAASTHTVDNVDWFSGTGLIGFETTLPLDEPISTTLNDPQLNTPYVTTYYFETEFTFNGAAEGFELQLNNIIDDGAVFYLNGVEIHRQGMDPNVTVTPSTFATGGVNNATYSGPVTVPHDQLIIGQNRLSVEVHQVNEGSSDIVFGTEILIAEKIDDGTPGTPGTGYTENPEEWIELYNRSNDPVNLTGWSLDGAVSFDFPDNTTINPGEYLLIANDPIALAAKHPGIADQIVGEFSGKLSNSNELLQLIDPVGNPADEVHYYDSGRWSSLADGEGSSLELKNPIADNAQAEAWAGSDESGHSTWETYTYRGVAVNDGLGNNIFNEFVLGLLSDGVVLFDDFRIIEDPDGAATQFLPNGNFESDTIGQIPAGWLMVGTHGDHGNSMIIDDPDNPGNKVMRLVTDGPTEDKHNHVSSTYNNNQPITFGQTYEISYKAKWISGSNQVNTRLYFNELQRTTLIDVPEELIGGTPGAINSQYQTNAGPTYTNFKHGPVVPEPGQAVTVSVNATDSDDIASMTLFYAVQGGGYSQIAMTHIGNGKYEAQIPGQSSGQVVQFYVQGQDTLGATSTFPAEGADSRAMYEVNDGRAVLGGMHNVRIIMTPDDVNFMYAIENRMSNSRQGATVIYNESEIFYNVGVRVKGSAFGRFSQPHAGISIQFQSDNLFRDVHPTISIERSANPKELLGKHMLNRASGGLVSYYDDIAHIMPSGGVNTGVGLLSMSRTSDVYLESAHGSDANETPLFNFELLYSPNGTIAGLGTQKRNNPYTHNNGHPDIEDLGDDKEAYRWNFQIRNSRGRDDYAPLIQLGKALSQTGQQLEDSVAEIMDVDQWMRTFAMMSINGNDDFYGRIYPHNFRFYQRPEDGKFVAIPWDLDRAFQLATNAHPWAQNDFTGTPSNISKVIERPKYNRLFWGHVLDITNTTANNNYMQDWTDHYGQMLGRSFAAELNYINARTQFLLSQINAYIPQVDFEITTNGGADVNTPDSTITIQGTGWIDVRQLRDNLTGDIVEVTWLDDSNWQATFPLLNGQNTFDFTAYDHQNNEVGSDSIIVTSTATTPVFDFLRVSELNYNPSDLTQTEIDAGFTDSDQFEFIELINISTTETLDLTGVAITDGVTFDFTGSSVTSLAPGQFVLVVNDLAGFNQRYGAQAPDGTPYFIAGEYTDQLSNGGEIIEITDSLGLIVQQFEYVDGDDPGEEAWHVLTDGNGPSLNVIDPASNPDLNDPAAWEPSGVDLGTPGRTDPKVGAIPGDFNYDGIVNIADLAKLASNFNKNANTNPLLDIRWQNGDANADGIINISDLALLASNFNKTQFFGAGAAAVDLLSDQPSNQSLLLQDNVDDEDAELLEWSHIRNLLDDESPDTLL